MAKRLVIANWKMYVRDPKAAKDFASKLRRKLPTLVGTEVWLAPSFPLIPAIASKGSVKTGAQAVSSFEEGAHTGEVSALSLKQSGATFAIVGHSERRALFGDERVPAELRAAFAAGLKAVLCIGEKERDEHGGHFEALSKQLRTALSDSGKTDISKLVIAYEPVWAIGKSAADAMAPAQVRETVIFIRKIVADLFGRTESRNVPILYGGSVEKENARELIEGGEVSGFLVGHASANFEDFYELLKMISKK